MTPKDIQRRLGANLRAARKARRLTQFELAEKADVSEDTIKSIELSRFWPSLKTLSQISDALGMDIHNLFLPTPGDIKAGGEVLEKVRGAVSQSYMEFVKSVIENLRGPGGL